MSRRKPGESVYLLAVWQQEKPMNELDPITQWLVDLIFGSVRDVLSFVADLLNALVNPFGV